MRAWHELSLQNIFRGHLDKMEKGFYLENFIVNEGLPQRTTISLIFLWRARGLKVNASNDRGFPVQMETGRSLEESTHCSVCSQGHFYLHPSATPSREAKHIECSLQACKVRYKHLFPSQSIIWR